MLPNISKTEVLKWFTGKPRERAEHALFLLSESEAEGFWIPGASRKVRAALGKHNVATKLVNQYKDNSISSDLESIRCACPRDRYGGMKNPCECTEGSDLCRTMQYGSFERLIKYDIRDLKKFAKTEAQKEALKPAVDYYNSFIEVAKLMRHLDECRPKPVFTKIGVSPTITKTLEDASLDLNIGTIRVCPSKTVWQKVKRIDKAGKEYEVNVPFIILLWPKDTQHDCSRFAYYSHQCHSCGHTIHNPFNWVPILIDNKKGVPHSLWIGRDCAARVFGIKVTGDIEIQGGKTGGTKK